MMKKQLSSYRNQIDHIDSQILKLLSHRGRLANAIGKIKQTNGKSIHVPSREKVIYDRLIKMNKGPFKSEAILSIFREIISATRALEAPLCVSYLGPQATFTHMAAVKYFGSSAEMVAASNIQTIFEEVERGHSEYGVVPIENSSEGIVSHTLDMFAHSSLNVCAEIVLKVSHHLLSQETKLSQIKKVYSHPHALAQCHRWLMNNIPGVILKETESTGYAAQKAAGESHVAAIASEIAASIYGLPLLKKGIQDQTQNYTRFLVIGHHMAQRTGEDKTTILFTIHDEAGGLYKVLEPFAKNRINLTKIESRPLKKRAWEYLFFVDIDGHLEEPRVKKALFQVQKKCVIFKVIGAYAKSRVQG